MQMMYDCDGCGDVVDCIFGGVELVVWVQRGFLEYEYWWDQDFYFDCL